MLKGHGEQEVSRSTLMRGTRNMTPRERDEALKTLAEQGLITWRKEDTPGRPVTYYRVLA